MFIQDSQKTIDSPGQFSWNNALQLTFTEAVSRTDTFKNKLKPMQLIQLKVKAIEALCLN